MEAARLLRSWVRIPPEAWIFVCCECRVLSGRGLCGELITRPEESYRLCCVVMCDLETSRIGAPCIYNISSLRVKCRLNSQEVCYCVYVQKLTCTLRTVVREGHSDDSQSSSVGIVCRLPAGKPIIVVRFYAGQSIFFVFPQ
jgi:hypothetical protein